jgi:hypothetical protein
LGYFSAVDVREPMQKITGKPYDIPAFSLHLKRFSDEDGHPILQKTGQSRRFKFRFLNRFDGTVRSDEGSGGSTHFRE